MSVTGAALLDRSHLVVPRSRARNARVRRVVRRGRALSLLLAVALGAGVAVWLLLTAFPGNASSGSAVPVPAPVEVVGPGIVVVSASCTDPGAQDTIAVDAPGGRRLLPLDACGNIVGATVTVRMSLDETGPPVPARMLGTGGDGALVANDSTATSPLTGRLAVLLTGVAGLGMAALLVAVVRERNRRSDSRRTVSVGSTLIPSVRRAARSTARTGSGRDSAGRGRRVTGEARGAATRTTSRAPRGRSAASCRTTSAARRPGDRPTSRRPAPGRRRH